jgi:nucleoside-diphosphate-sugar epimerase
MKVLVTGSEGYIGKHLCKMIQKTRPDIELYQLDKIDLEEQNYFCVNTLEKHSMKIK